MAQRVKAGSSGSVVLRCDRAAGRDGTPTARSGACGADPRARRLSAAGDQYLLVKPVEPVAPQDLAVVVATLHKFPAERGAL
ncbi:hypothetical protein GCM10017688_45620 [Streptomyces ramulosus]